MKKYMKTSKWMRVVGLLLSFAVILSGSIVLPGQAADDTYVAEKLLDATEDIAYCDGSNPNDVKSLGVTFMAMGSVKAEELSYSYQYQDAVLVPQLPAKGKVAYVLQFKNPIDTNEMEYLTLNMFVGGDTKVRVYASDTDNYIEDTAKEVLDFTTWDFEEKTITLKKYAEKDGYVRNITFYFIPHEHSLGMMIDSYQFTAYKEATEDLGLKAVENTYFVQSDLGPNQMPTYVLGDKGLLKDIGWTGAIYVDGQDSSVLKAGRYVTLKFDTVNTKQYETVEIDFYSMSDYEYTLYAYSADEMEYSEKTVDQVIKLKGGQTGKAVLETAKFADEYGYVSEINFLLADHSGAKGDGMQIFMGDMKFKLPREYANVTIYVEKLGGGYEKSDVSTTIEGKVGEEVCIEPYNAEEIGLYGYVYYSGGKNVLSGVLKDGEILDLRLYYNRKTFTVTVNNDGETTTEKVKYGATLDLMKYRKDNMLMNVMADGIAVEGISTTVTSDCVIDITQTPGNYIFFMVDGELFATRTYTPEKQDFVEPLVPIKEGYVGSWEEYELNGTDVTVNAVYEKSEVPVVGGASDENVLINVANKLKALSVHSVLLTILCIVGGVLVVAGIVVLVIQLVRKGKLGKRGLIIGGSAVAVCCAVVCVVLLWDAIIPKTNGKETETYTFEELYASTEEQEIAAGETLTFDIDKELKDKNYIQIDVDTDVNLLGTIEYYNLEDQNETNVEDFFIEGASTEVFHQFLDNFRKNGSGLFEKHLTKITITNISEEAGTVTMNKVAISDRIIDTEQTELYVENEYLKVGMDLLCGGALTYVERLPQDGQTLQEIVDADGNVKIGLNYGEREGAELLSESVNLINIYDKGREVQQSYYADVDEENGYTRGNYIAHNNQDWPYNPVQGGDQDDNSSQIIDYRIEDNELYIKVRAMDWGQHNSTTKSYMENWYTLNDDMLVVKNRFIDWNGFTGEFPAINSEMPAVYFAQALNTFVTYDGTAPWTGSDLDRQSALGSWADEDGFYKTSNPTEGWFAWVNEDDYGIGMYVPGVEYLASGRQVPTTSATEWQNSNASDSFMLTSSRPGITSDYTSCYVMNTDYTAPILCTTMDAYVPLEYSYAIRVDTVENLRNGFQTMDLQGAIDNSGMKAWDD